MTDSQLARSETLYRLNSELQDIWGSMTRLQALGAQIQPTIFDRTRRCFHWMAVHPDMWHLVPEQNQQLRQLLKTHFGAITTHLERTDRDPGLTESARILQQLGQSGDEDVHHAALMLLSSCDLPNDLYVDGIALRILKKDKSTRTHRLALLQCRLLWGWGHDTYRHFPWVKPTAHYYAIKRPQQRDARSQEYDAEASGKESARNSHRRQAVQIQQSRQEWAEDLLRFFMKLGRRARWPCHVFVVPIFDDPDLPWHAGALLGNVHVLLGRTKGKELAQARQEVDAYMRAQVGRLARALRAGAMAQIAAADPSGEDVVTHFARTIVMLQDWQRLIVFRGRKRYDCWCRSTGRWARCKSGCNSCVRELKKSPEGFLTSGSDLLAMVAPALELDARERHELQQLQFSFQYPDYAALPSVGTAGRTSLEHHYLRDQSDVWNLLLPKVLLRRRAEEAADRLATVAIIGRNLSHNIGSHVSSKLSDPTKITALLDDRLDSPERRRVTYSEVNSLPVLKMAMTPNVTAGTPRPESLYGSMLQDAAKGIRDLARFNAYLRDRMDFIAELATTRPSWSIPVPLKDLVSVVCNQRLVRKWLVSNSKEVKVWGDTYRTEIATLGENSRRQEDSKQSNDWMKMWVDVPHGVLGIQAFSMVLENVLRNSSRHGDVVEYRGQVVVRCPEAPTDTIHIEIVDLASPVRGSHQVTNSQSNSDAPSVANAKPTGTDLQDLIDRLKKRFYEGTTLLMNDWGLKEIKIGAAFLRRRPPEFARDYGDSEGTPGYSATRSEPWIQPVRSAVRVAGKDEERLAWRLVLLKPKQLAVIGNSETRPELRLECEKSGIAPFAAGTVESAVEELGCYQLAACIDQRAAESLAEKVASRAVSRLHLPTRLLLPAGISALSGLEPYATMSPEVHGLLKGLLKDPHAGEGQSQEPPTAEVALAQLWGCWVTSLASSTDKRPELRVYDDSAANDTWCLGEDRVSETQPAPRIVYKRHKSSRPSNLSELQFYQEYTGDMEAYSVISSAVRESEETSTIQWRLIEAGLVKVYIVDERLSDWLSKEPDEIKQERQTLLLAAGIGVHVFGDTDALTVPELDPDEVSRALLRATGDARLVFLTIHQNILTNWVPRILKTEDNGRAMTPGQWVDRVRGGTQAARDAGGQPGRLIITAHTGRGRPPNLPVGVPFLEWSNIERYVRDNPSKFHLVSLFLNLREIPSV